PVPVSSAVLAFTAGLALVGGMLWWRATAHRRSDEERSREDEAKARDAARALRKRLSDLRLRLDRVARGGGFADATALLKAHRRARLAEEKRRTLIERSARRDAAAARLKTLEGEIAPFRTALSCPAGLPAPDDARRFL